MPRPKIKELTRPEGPLSSESVTMLAKLMQAGLIEIRYLISHQQEMQALKLANALHNLPEILFEPQVYDIAEDVRQELLTYQLNYIGKSPINTDYVSQLEDALTK